jgi:hypothetical protein
MWMRCHCQKFVSYNVGVILKFLFDSADEFRALYSHYNWMNSLGLTHWCHHWELMQQKYSRTKWNLKKVSESNRSLLTTWLYLRFLTAQFLSTLIHMVISMNKSKAYICKEIITEVCWIFWDTGNLYMTMYLVEIWSSQFVILYCK